MKILRLLLLGLGLAAFARADVTLAPLFTDHAVLQCDKPLPVWGRAEPGEHVTVEFKGQAVGATTGNDGRWIVYLEPVPASAEPAELVVTGKNTLKVADLLVGEVWLVGGQSNMEWDVAHANNAAKEVAEANFPLLRHIKVEHAIADDGPHDTAKTSGWQAATPATAGTFSAIGFFFGRDLVRKLSVPVGIVNCTWGGTPIEAWMSGAALQGTAAWATVKVRWQKDLAESVERKANWPREYEAWKQAEEHAKATKTKNVTPYPRPNRGPGSPYAINVLFNGMMAPLQPYALRGFLWYQGESNWAQPGEYADLFPAMIRAWRAGFGLGDAPFYFVQLAAYSQGDDPTHRGWAYLREAQTRALALPAVAMVTAIDIGDPKDIHPRNKQEVGAPPRAGCQDPGLRNPRRLRRPGLREPRARGARPAGALQPRQRRADLLRQAGAVAGTRRRRPRVPSRHRPHRARHAARHEPRREGARGRALRLVQRPRRQPLQRRRPARAAVPQRRVVSPPAAFSLAAPRG